MQRQCTKCGETKPLDAFYRDAGKPDGRRKQCKACDEARAAVRKEVHRDRIVARRKELWAAADREARAAKRRAQYLADRERRLAKQNAYSAANREREAARCRAWRAANPDRVKALYVRYYRENRESLLEWARRYQASNPEIIRANRRRRYARVRGAQIRPFKAADWQATLDGFNGHCAYCLKPMPEVTMDHMTPVARGGEHAIENVVPSCFDCNIWKYDRTLLEFLVMQQTGVRSRGHYLTLRSARETTSRGPSSDH